MKIKINLFARPGLFYKKLYGPDENDIFLSIKLRPVEPVLEYRLACKIDFKKKTYVCITYYGDERTGHQKHPLSYLWNHIKKFNLRPWRWK